MKNLKKDHTGVAPLKHQNQLVTDSLSKASALNAQFQSIFTQEPPGSLPDKGPSPHPTMPEIQKPQHGIEKLLKDLNVHKAMGPDEISSHFLKETRSVTSFLLKIIFQCSLETEVTPQDWREAYVAPLFKKGE